MSFRARARRREGAIAWNDIEALPLHGAAVLMLLFALFIVADIGQDIRMTALKTLGVVGSIALRYAWVRLDEEEGSRVAREAVVRS